MTTVSPDMPLDPKHYASMFWRRKGVILLAVLTVFCSALVALSFMPNEYEATVSLIFEEPQTQLPEVTVQAPSGYREEARLQAFASEIRSRPFLARVVRMLPEMTADPKVRAAAEEIYRRSPQLSVDETALRLVVERVQSQLRFGSTGTGVYQVVVADNDPQTAQQLAQYIGEFYKDDAKQRADTGYEESINWLRDQYRQYEEESKNADTKLEQFHAQQVKEALPRSSVRAENLAMAEVLQRRVRQAAEEAASRVQVSADGLAKVPINRASADAIWQEDEFRQHGERLKASLISRVDDLLTVQALAADEPPWPPTDAQYIDLRQRLRSGLEGRVRSIRRQASDAAVNAYVAYAFACIDAQIQSGVARDLDQRIEVFKQQAEDQPAQTLELQKLEQDAQDKRALLELFRGKETTNKIQQAIQQANLGRQVRILDPPQLPLSPSRPNRLKILLGALLLGTLFGLGLAFLGETMDPTVRTLADIQRIAPEPILCTTPLLSKLQPRVHGLRRFWLPAAVSAVLLLTVAFFVARSTVLGERVPGARPAGAATEAQSGR